ncbi:MAG: hypothetical protein U1E49_00870 [Hyphomicrobiaceae bacterium]
MTVVKKVNLRYAIYLGTTLITASIATGSFLAFSATAGRGAGESSADGYLPEAPSKPAAEAEDGYEEDTGGAADSADDQTEETSSVTTPDEGDAASGKAARQDKTNKKGKSSKGSFRPDPMYTETYDTMEQTGIYGDKTAVEPPRPILELGRQQYTSGPYDESSTIFGELNPLVPGLAIYGDSRTAIAYNSNNGKDIAQVATRLNIDVDLKLTGTERIHAFFTPLQEDNRFTRFEFGGGDGDGELTSEFDPDLQTLFFEGDAGSIYSGFSGEEASFDLPFTVGLFPLFLQNGIWANDAILGGAVTLPAKNSAALGLSNFDITFFGAFDNVDNASIVNEDGKVDNNKANLFGVTTFIDAFDGYIEAGYGLVQGVDDRDDVLDHYLTAAYSRRYYNTLSNTTRLFANFSGDGNGDRDGFAVISENSLISGLPSTLVPYANFFIGVGNPKPLVDGNGAGILKNVGINFETDALTGYPKLDDTGSNTFGGAIGLQYLFDLDQQLVFEVAFVEPFEDDGIGTDDTQIGLGMRYQVPITQAWLFRADATYQFNLGDAEDNFGVRAEVRRKF